MEEEEQPPEAETVREKTYLVEVRTPEDGEDEEADSEAQVRLN